MASNRNAALAVKAKAEDGIEPQLLARITRHRLRAQWDIVWGMLTGTKPRRAADGRDVYEVWADMVLADPPGEIARALTFFPKEHEPKQGDNTTATVNNIGALYLQAVQSANRIPDPRIIELGTNLVQPDVSDW
jgi:hypothetical protein